MRAPTPVWIVDDDPASAAAALVPDRTVVDGIPDDPEWDLEPEALVWPVTVDDPSQCPSVLEAVVRGVAVVVRVVDPMGGPTTARFVDELHRAAGRDTADPGDAGDRIRQLTAEQRRLLAALAAGQTLASAAAQVGIAPRTASRRLTEIRRILGCSTTAEAVVAFSRSPSGLRLLD